jgi:hypothetical protein
MKKIKLEKIAKELAHPFISILPNQEYFDKKLEWYKPYKGILESASAEILLPLVYVSINTNLTSIAISGLLVLDGMGRINKLLDELPPSENPTKINYGTIFLEAPYILYKKIIKR